MTTTTPNAPANLECVEQRALFTWREDYKGKIDALEFLHAIPNGAYFGGGAMAARRANRLKAEGLTPGVWDAFLPAPMTNTATGERWGGLYIEMKRRGEKPTKNQDWFRKGLERNDGTGYAFAVCFTWIEAARTICQYLGVHPEAHGVPK